jgi:hypothetical protein
VNARFEKRLLVVWLALSSMTIASSWVGALEGRDAQKASTAITFGVIVLALVKVRIIFREFMEVRHAPVLLGRLTDTWILLTAAILLGTYFAGMATS